MRHQDNNQHSCATCGTSLEKKSINPMTCEEYIPRTDGSYIISTGDMKGIELKQLSKRQIRELLFARYLDKDEYCRIHEYADANFEQWGKTLTTDYCACTRNRHSCCPAVFMVTCWMDGRAEGNDIDSKSPIELTE